MTRDLDCDRLEEKKKASKHFSSPQVDRSPRIQKFYFKWRCRIFIKFRLKFSYLDFIRHSGEIFNLLS